MNRAATDGELAFAERVKHPQLFGDGPRGQFAADGAFAFKNLLQVKAHGVSVRNCRSNFCQASTRSWRATMAWKRGASSAPASTNCSRRALSLARPVWSAMAARCSAVKTRAG